MEPSSSISASSAEQERLTTSLNNAGRSSYISEGKVGISSTSSASSGSASSFAFPASVGMGLPPKTEMVEMGETGKCRLLPAAPDKTVFSASHRARTTSGRRCTGGRLLPVYSRHRNETGGDSSFVPPRPVRRQGRSPDCASRHKCVQCQCERFRYVLRGRPLLCEGLRAASFWD